MFDTTYVSIYKGVGALPGCYVAGEQRDIAQVREWRSRLGGTLFALWLWPRASTTGDPHMVRVELTVGHATLDHFPEFIADTRAALPDG